jgi:catechol 2,3-dioxygenase-like lactoylglutathione lyase family enzyme
MSAAIGTSASLHAVPAITGVHHLGLTVRDVVASEAWYAQVLGLVRVFVEPHGTGNGYAVVMTRPGTSLFVGLDHHPDADREVFSPLRTGLDHLALELASRHELDEWISHLDANGVEHGAVSEGAEPAPHAMLVFRDPDGIPIELFWIGG